ncbi:MAG: hypothetical protein K8U57_19730 [Planctomycetes bacterium]|nr:hypothetical protein [Planctomycetota bacterium]
MPDLVRFDNIPIALWIPRDTDDAVADAARAALDEPAFLASFTSTIRQLFATIPALAVLSVTLEE